MPISSAVFVFEISVVFSVFVVCSCALFISLSNSSLSNPIFLFAQLRALLSCIKKSIGSFPFMVYSLPMLCVLFVFKVSLNCVFYSGFASTVCETVLPGPTTLGAGATVSSFAPVVKGSTVDSLGLFPDFVWA